MSTMICNRFAEQKKILKEKEGEMRHFSLIPGSSEGVVYLIGEQ